MKTTKSGLHTIFNIEEGFVSEDNLSSSHFDEWAKGESLLWFFQPTDWFPNSEWYGSIISTRHKKLMIYSCGFSTSEEALVAAENWEKSEFYIQDRHS
jgi:hypothetical protein